MYHSIRLIRFTVQRAASSGLRALSMSLLALLLFAAGSLSAAGVIGGQLFATGGNVTVEVLPATAGYVSELHLFSPGPDSFIALNTDVGTVVNLGSFTAGEELIFGIYVRNTGETYKMGPGSRNPDGIEHDGVQNTGPGEAIVGFEDLFGGGDRDYDDNVFKFTGGIAPLACPPDVTVPTDSGACSGEQNPQGNIAGLIFVPVGFASAKVNYTVPSVPGATVNCVPPPGSAFPVGTNSVTCTANYTRGDVVTCSFTVVVVPGRGVKECVKAQLDALLTTVTDKKDRAALIEAADDDLAESLAPQLWLDQLHLDRKLGGTVFQEERETSKILCALMKKNNSHISAALLQSYIDQLILVDRTIALIAINEAAAAGVPAKTIKNALKDLAKGDAEIHGDKCYKAFDFYKSAWKQVQLAPH